MPATPFSYRQYAGNGSTTSFSVPFPYLLKAHVKVFLGYNLLDGTFASELADGADFNWTSATQIQLTIAPTTGQTLTVIRQTPTETQVVGWQDGSNLIADDLDVADKQNLYVVQEQADRTALAVAAASDALSELTDLTTYGENYLGALASDPAAKPGGGDIQEGNLYYNTTTERFRVFGDGLWSDGAAPTTLFRWKRVAVGGETSLSGGDDNGQELAYTADFEQVYVNGTLLVRGVQYTAINGTSITGLTALTAGDVVEVISFNAFTIGVAPTEVDFTGLTAANQPIADSDLFLLRQGASNKKVTAAVFRTELATDAQAAQAAAETAQAAAENAQSGAQTARTAAETARNGAETARAAAETARDAALLNADIYPTTAAGIAAVAVGGYFQTYSGNTNDFLNLYRVDTGPVATLVTTYPSRAFFSFFELDSGYDEFYRYAWTDSQYRLSMAIKPDGTVRVEKGDIGTLSVNSITAPGGSIDLDSVDTPLVNIADGGAIDGDLGYNDFYQLIETDANGRISRAVTTDGTNYLPKMSADSLSAGTATIGTLNVNSFANPAAVHSADGIFAVESVSGTSQIIRYSNGIRTQLTTVGANTAPSITAETPARVLFSSTRTGTQSYQVMNTDGSRVAHAIAPKNTAIWGDSMTAFLGTSYLASALGDSRRIISNGYGGRNSVFIARRQGGYLSTGTISGAQIPASGSVSVTGLAAPVDNDFASFSCSVNGIAGTLNHNGGSPTFTRSVAGSAVPVTNPVTFVPILDDVISGVTYHACEYTSILWLGRNGVGGAPGDTDVSVYTGMINEIRNLSKRILILPIFNGGYSTESNGDPAIPTVGTDGYDAIMSRNASIAAAFPQYWYDVRRDFIDGAAAWLQANYPAVYASDWTQAFPGKQQANLGPDSAWDVANDVPPRALRADNIHINAYGNEFLGELIATKLQSLGW